MFLLSGNILWYPIDNHIKDLIDIVVWKTKPKSTPNVLKNLHWGFKMKIRLQWWKKLITTRGYHIRLNYHRHDVIPLQQFKVIQVVSVRFLDTSATQQRVTIVILTATWHLVFPVLFKESCWRSNRVKNTSNVDKHLQKEIGSLTKMFKVRTIYK